MVLGDKRFASSDGEWLRDVKISRIAILSIVFKGFFEKETLRA